MRPDFEATEQKLHNLPSTCKTPPQHLHNYKYFVHYEILIQSLRSFKMFYSDLTLKIRGANNLQLDKSIYRPKLRE